MYKETGILNVEVAEGPALSELLESGLVQTLCVFKLANGEWLEGFAESIDYEANKAFVRVRSAIDGRQYLVAYDTTSTKGRVLEAL